MLFVYNKMAARTKLSNEIMNLNFGSGIYRSKDPIHNFKIRIKLEKHKSRNLVSFQRGENDENPQRENELEMRELSNLNPNAPTDSETEEFVFTWQDKIFSEHEYRLYSDKAQCSTPLQQKYYQIIKGLGKKGGRPTRRLFSYVDADEDPEAGMVTTLPSQRRTFLEEIRGNLRRRPSGRTNSRESGRWTPSTTDVVHFHSSKALRGWPDANWTKMHIMADLGPESESTDGSSEALLCTVSYDGREVVTVRPDFNDSQNPYEIDGTYRYTIENASNDVGTEEREREAKMFRELYDRHSGLLSSHVGHDFLEPENEQLELHIFGEIVSAEDFEYDGLYVEFFIDLHGDWTAGDDDPNYGVTQKCKTKCVDRRRIAYFGHPFQYHLSCPLEILAGENTDNVPRWPQLCFQVSSEDAWNRLRVEGYGYVDFPTAPGTLTRTVRTWRPLNPSPYGRLQRFFLSGCTPHLEDPSSYAVPVILQPGRMSRYGMRTESTGAVTLRIHTVQQCRAFTTSEDLQNLGKLTGRLRSSTLHSSVEAVLEAFHRARRRMIAARKNLNF